MSAHRVLRAGHEDSSQGSEYSERSANTIGALHVAFLQQFPAVILHGFVSIRQHCCIDGTDGSRSRD